MKVSVVVPVFNEEKYIAGCLDRLTSQTRSADEIIVVDNNSSDNTIKIAKKYGVRIISEKTQGMIPARNKGFNSVKYDIIARTDADTLVPIDWIERIKADFSNSNIDAISGPIDFYEIPSSWSKRAVKNIYNSYYRIIKAFLKHDFFIGSNMALRTKAWINIKDQVCLSDKEVHEDIDLSIHLAQYGKIKLDRHLIVTSSFRRWKSLDSYFEYSYRTVKSIQKHKQYALRQKSKQLVKKLYQKAYGPLEIYKQTDR